jgi:hypothetical protein
VLIEISSDIQNTAVFMKKEHNDPFTLSFLSILFFRIKSNWFMVLAYQTKMRPWI